ncbi:MAG TPA: SpoIIE family protein phosphatase [Thermoanaerobaculia bacterium]|nr:SpoIIE family protein phosphatase [Thermoanaerobaculia bacterium]
MEKPSPRRTTLLVGIGIAAVAGALSWADIPYLSAFLRLVLLGSGVLLLLWLLWRGLRVFLWKVGRRLAFSYFLIGVLPIPMVLLLLGFVAYLLAGFFLGHVFRDAVDDLQGEMELLARGRAAALVRHGAAPASPVPGISFVDYRNGRRVGDDRRLPATWPAWTAARQPHGEATYREPESRFFARPDGTLTLAAAAAQDGWGTVAVYTGHLGREISRRAGLWIEVDPPGQQDSDVVQLQIWDRRIPLQRLQTQLEDPEGEKFLKRLSRGERFWDDAMLSWGEISGPLYDLASGRQLSEFVVASLRATPRNVSGHLFTGSAVDASTWLAVLLLSLLLLNVYCVATVMAVFMIFGLSRAVNRLSRGTTAVRQGDFSVRIPVRRKDQVGDLQRSFNEMAGDLETLVASATQKELLDKELALARDLQKSLLPTDLPAPDRIEIATLFEPSAALGGDYFDVLRLSERELAVIIADVSGHGLSTGLRMAMIKAAFTILIEETQDPEQILRRLDTVVRTRGEKRFFVTATLSLLDLATGSLRLTNAGHPPTYLVRRGEAEEILLPGSALGGLGRAYGKRTLQLEPGDVLVWLSDGLIEATDAAGEPFSYEGVARALTDGTNPGGLSAFEIRDRLLAAVARHTGGTPPDDDRTLVVMRWKG